MSLSLAAATLLVAAAARADVVPPAPKSCPPGSFGETSHGGAYCSPTTCSTDTDCKRFQRRSDRPLVCKLAPLCVSQKKIPAPRTPGSASAKDREVPAAVECSPKCGTPASCEVFKRCVPEDAAPARPASGSGCRCALEGRASSSIPAALLPVALAIAAARRRHRARVESAPRG